METRSIDCSKPFCFGCGICAVVCKNNAIVLKLSKYGFLKPEVNHNLCVDCGMCRRVCPENSRKDQESSIFKGKIYMGYTKDEEVRKTTSSGGIAFELAQYLLHKGYKVIGAVYDYKDNIVRHNVIENENHLETIKGSKYLQSYTIDAVKDLVNNSNEKYVFFGTPCQVYGIRKYITSLRQQRDNIILIDHFCHGVPTYNLWKGYLKYIVKKHKIDSSGFDRILFRDKLSGWHDYSMIFHLGNKVFTEKKSENIFYSFYLTKSCLNKNCYECSFREGICASDLRLGDFWGTKYKDNEKGVSLIVAMNKKGLKALDGLGEKIVREQSSEDDMRKSQYFGFFSPPLYYEKLLEKLSLSDSNLHKLQKKYVVRFKKRVKKYLKFVLPGSLVRMIKKK